MGQLKQLKTLELQGNQLERLPAGLMQAEALRILRLGDNQLRQLPEEIGNLKQLKVLNLGEDQLSEGNQLVSLPNSLGQLQ